MRVIKRVGIFSLTSLITLALGVFIGRHRAPLQPQHLEPSPWQILLLFENQHLENLNEQSDRAVRQAIEALTGLPKQKFYREFSPRLFRTISNTKGETRYILVEEAPLNSIPGESLLRVNIFDTTGKLLSSEEFNAGWRTVLIGVNIRKVHYPTTTGSTVEQDMLVADGEYCFGGSPSHEDYALVGDKVSLVYLEVNGHLETNDYQDRNLTIGPLRPERSADDWQKALQSDEPAEVMAALIWIGGSHWSGQAHPYDEDKSEAEKVAALRSREVVRKRIMELAQSPDLRIQPMAKAAWENNFK